MSNGVSSSPEVKEAVSVVRNRRTDAMFVACFGAILWFVYLVVFHPEISEYAQGVITLVLGAFVQIITAMYSFETGTTRATQAKDTTIKAMAESAVAAPKAEPIKADTMKVDADSVVVNNQPPKGTP